MPAITEKETVDKIVGMVCDVCGKTVEHQIGLFLNHTFGYGSQHDGTRVSATICDACVHQLLKTHVPGAVFKVPKYLQGDWSEIKTSSDPKCWVPTHVAMDEKTINEPNYTVRGG